MSDPYELEALLLELLLELVVAGMLQAEVRPSGEVVYWCEDPDALSAYVNRGPA